MANGVKFGRKQKLSEYQRKEARDPGLDRQVLRRRCEHDLQAVNEPTPGGLNFRAHA